MNLVIVESPAKAKTIEKFLGKDFKVVSCFGHISDLPSKELGVNVDGDFNPNYIVSDDKKKVVKELKLLADKAEKVWLASDEDREGEAIAWHLNNQLKLSENKTQRIVFREITKTAILNAVKNPRQINNNLVDAQQARRVLDRLVGYELSPILWRKVKGGLSAGRVQSVSVRILVEREREIEDFITNYTFKVQAEFPVNDSFFKANCSQSFESKKNVESFLKSLIDDRFLVMGIEKKPSKRSPSAPFITSTLQQESSRKLGFSVSRTMSNAQRLYESGLITYMRTDSTNLSNQAQNVVKELINEKYGSEFLFNRSFKTNKKGAQEAHEAVRPTNFQISPANSDEAIKDFDQKKLYDLIWRRTVASQMSDAKFEISTLKIQSVNTNQIFTAKGEIITFEGFMKVYFEGSDNESSNSPLLPNLIKGSAIKPKSIISTQRFTKPPSRFTEASLVKKLEELGIGRPSTYAPTITTIID
ncbi:MAG: type I DNA topoisomerase, partial [Bacteroidota bacterium]|nr:type I DNA topoisomerase [Bacteroidota bacterium]